MTRLSGKTVRDRSFPVSPGMGSDFDLSESNAQIRDKGYTAIFEKAYNCPCKSKNSTHIMDCKNCGGTGWIFCNPIKTKFIVTGVTSDSKLKEAALREWGLIDTGVVNVTAVNDDKFTYMDRITLLDATAEHNQLLYPALTDDETQTFAYTQYTIKSIDSIMLYVAADQPLTRLTATTHYAFIDNKITFTVASGVGENSTLTIRYTHNPVFHIIDITRESMTSYRYEAPAADKKLILPIKGIAKRAHLIKDVENFDGDRLLDNSWLPACEVEDLTAFQRQLRYTSALNIYNSLTQSQKNELEAIFDISV